MSVETIAGKRKLPGASALGKNDIYHSKLQLQCSDGKLFDVTHEEAMMSSTLWMLLHDIMDKKAKTPVQQHTVPIFDVPSSSVALALYYCRCLYQQQVEENHGPMQAWNEKFMDLDSKTLCDLAKVASNLDIQPLVDITCRSIAQIMSATEAADEIRQKFGLDDPPPSIECSCEMRNGMGGIDFDMFNALDHDICTDEYELVEFDQPSVDELVSFINGENGKEALEDGANAALSGKKKKKKKKKKKAINTPPTSVNAVDDSVIMAIAAEIERIEAAIENEMSHLSPSERVVAMMKIGGITSAVELISELSVYMRHYGMEHALDRFLEMPQMKRSSKDKKRDEQALASKHSAPQPLSAYSKWILKTLVHSKTPPPPPPPSKHYAALLSDEQQDRIRQLCSKLTQAVEEFRQLSGCSSPRQYRRKIETAASTTSTPQVPNSPTEKNKASIAVEHMELHEKMQLAQENPSAVFQESKFEDFEDEETEIQLEEFRLALEEAHLESKAKIKPRIQFAPQDVFRSGASTASTNSSSQKKKAR